jgi:hypothetical protein
MMIDDTDVKLYAQRLKELEQKVKFHSKQLAVKKAIFQDGFKKIFCRKGRKAGGTEVALYPAFRICGTQRNKIGYIIYPNSPTADRILDQTGRLRSYAPKEWQCEYTWNDKKREVRFPLTNSVIYILGAHQWESMQGFEFDFCIFDELADHDPRAYQYCYPNVAPRNALWIVIGAPPLDLGNYYLVIEEEALANPDIWSFHKWNLYDNSFLPEEFVKQIPKEKAMHYARGEDDIWTVQWEAEYCKSNRRTVLACYDKKRHASRPRAQILAELKKDESAKTFLGLFDPGYSVCFAFILMAYSGAKQKIYILDELYEKDRRNMSAWRVWNSYMDKRRGLGVFGRWTNIYDSAATGFATEVRDLPENRLAPPPLLPTFKQSDDENTYFRVINNLFYEDRFEIASECENTKSEVQGYMTTINGGYPDSKNHILDLMRYGTKWLEKNMAGFCSNVEEIQTSYSSDMREAQAALWGDEAFESKNQSDWPFFD